MAENIVYEYKRVGYHFKLFPNRIEFRQPGGLVKKETTILLRSISSVDIIGLGKELQITTNDSKTHKMSIFHKDAEKAKAAILSQL